jgi:hypothetical protein
MFGVPEVSYHQTYSAKDWLSILRTPCPTQNLQKKHRPRQFVVGIVMYSFERSILIDDFLDAEIFTK